MTVKRDKSGRLLKGSKLNETGKSVNSIKKVNNLLTDDKIVYTGDDLAYIKQHITALSQAGEHDKALQLLIDTLPYRVPKISSIPSEQEDKELSISFQDVEEIPQDHPLHKLLKE